MINHLHQVKQLLKGKRAWLLAVGVFWLLLIVLNAAIAAQATERIRFIVLTDVDGRGDKSGSGCPVGDDSDDHASLVRLMVYSNEFDIEGIYATTNSDGKVRPCPEIIRNVVNLYGEVLSNLRLHASGYPSKQYLLDRIKVGINGNRMTSVGEGKSSEASTHLKKVVDAALSDPSDDRPIWIISWDGLVTLAQALYEVKRDRTPAQLDAFVDKIRVYTISEDTDVEPWIRHTFPNLFYIWADRRSTYSGVSNGGDRSYFNKKWWSINVQNGHGPLGADYVDASSSLPEGDTPSFLYLMTFTGINDPYHPEYGGWGGRYTRQIKGGSEVWSDAIPGDTYRGGTDNARSVWRWRSAFQNDFAARMDWCVKPFDEANHPPVPAFNGNVGTEAVVIGVEENEIVRLSSKGSTDPDKNDLLSYKWYTYPEAGTYKRNVDISDNTSQQASIKVPGASDGKTIHIILEVTDDGEPPLTRYRRIILKVGGKR